MNFKSKFAKISSGVAILTIGVAVPSYLKWTQNADDRRPSAEVDEGKVEAVALRDNLEHSVRVVDAVGSYVSEDDLGGLAAVADLVNLFDGRVTRKTPDQIASTEQNVYGMGVQEAYKKLKTDKNIKASEIESSGNVILEAADTMRQALEKSQKNLRFPGGQAARVLDSVDQLRRDVKLGRREAIVEDFEFETMLMAPRLMAIAFERSDKDPQKFGAAFAHFHDRPKKAHYSTVRSRQLGAAIASPQGLSASALRNQINEVYEDLWKVEASRPSELIRTADALLDLYVVSRLSSVSSQSTASVTQAWGEVYIRTSRAIARTGDDTRIKGDDQRSQSLTRSTEEIASAMRMGLDSLVRLEDLQAGNDRNAQDLGALQGNAKAQNERIGKLQDAAKDQGERIGKLQDAATDHAERLGKLQDAAKDQKDRLQALQEGSDQNEFQGRVVNNKVNWLILKSIHDSKLFADHLDFLERMVYGFQVRNERRFDAIDTNLDDLYKTITENFETVKKALRVAKVDAEALKKGIRSLSVSLDRMDNRLSGFLAASEARNLNQVMERCVNRKENFTSEQMTFEKFQDCISDLIAYGTGSSSDAYSVDDASRSYDDQSLGTELMKPMERNLSFLARVAAEVTDAKGQAVASDLRAYQRLSNPVEWNVAADAIMNLMSDWPEYTNRMSEVGLGRMLDVGDEINRFATAITRDSQGTPRRELFNEVFARYEKREKAFFNAFDGYAKEYQKQAIASKSIKPGVRIFARTAADFKTILHDSKTQFSVPASLAACTDVEISQPVANKNAKSLSDLWSKEIFKESLAAPSTQWSAALMDSLSPYFVAQYLELGNISVCVESLQWIESVASKKNGSGSFKYVGKAKASGRAAKSMKANNFNNLESILGETPANKNVDAMKYLGADFEMTGKRSGTLSLKLRLNFESVGRSETMGHLSYESQASVDYHNYSLRYKVDSWKPIEDQPEQERAVMNQATLKETTVKSNVVKGFKDGLSALNWPAKFKAATPDLERAPDLTCLEEGAAKSKATAQAHGSAVVQLLCNYFNQERAKFAAGFEKQLDRGAMKKQATALNSSQMLVADLIQVGMSPSLDAYDDFHATFWGASGLRPVSERFFSGVVKNDFNPLQFRDELEANLSNLEQQMTDFFENAEIYGWIPEQPLLTIDAQMSDLSALREEQLATRQSREKISDALAALSGRVLEVVSKVKNTNKASGK